MIRVLYDLNVILDVMLDRAPHVHASAAALALAERREVEGWICAASVDTLHYLLARATDAPTAKRHLHTLLGMLKIADVTDGGVRAALRLDWRDLEDAILYQSARDAALMGIVSRNARDFALGSLPVYSPEELLALYRSMARSPNPSARHPDGQAGR